MMKKLNIFVFSKTGRSIMLKRDPISGIYGPISIEVEASTRGDHVAEVMRAHGWDLVEALRYMPCNVDNAEFTKDGVPCLLVIAKPLDCGDVPSDHWQVEWIPQHDAAERVLAANYNISPLARYLIGYWSRMADPLAEL